MIFVIKHQLKLEEEVGAFSEYCERYRESSLTPLLSEDSGGQGSDESSVSLLRAGSCCSIQTCNDFSVFL